MPPGEMIERGEKAEGGRYDYCWAIFDHGHQEGSLPVFSWLHRDKGAMP